MYVSERDDSAAATVDLMTSEDDYDHSATFFVPDRDCADDTSNRAVDTLPRNLILAPSKLNPNVSCDVTKIFYANYVCRTQCSTISGLIMSTSPAPRDRGARRLVPGNGARGDGFAWFLAAAAAAANSVRRITIWKD